MSEIVEFLKSPLVQGDHRRAFLDLLECRDGRRFGNPWSFVEYAPAENLGLDFTVFTQQPRSPNSRVHPTAAFTQQPRARNSRVRETATRVKRPDPKTILQDIRTPLDVEAATRPK